MLNNFTIPGGASLTQTHIQGHGVPHYNPTQQPIRTSARSDVRVVRNITAGRT